MVKIIFNVCLGVVVIALIGIVIRQELLLDRLDNDFEQIAEAHNKNADALIKTMKLVDENEAFATEKRLEQTKKIWSLEDKLKELDK